MGDVRRRYLARRARGMGPELHPRRPRPDGGRVSCLTPPASRLCTNGLGSFTKSWTFECMNALNETHVGAGARGLGVGGGVVGVVAEDDRAVVHSALAAAPSSARASTQCSSLTTWPRLFHGTLSRRGEREEGEEEGEKGLSARRRPDRYNPNTAAGGGDARSPHAPCTARRRARPSSRARRARACRAARGSGRRTRRPEAARDGCEGRSSR